MITSESYNRLNPAYGLYGSQYPLPKKKSKKLKNEKIIMQFSQHLLMRCNLILYIVAIFDFI